MREGKGKERCLNVGSSWMRVLFDMFFFFLVGGLVSKFGEVNGLDRIGCFIVVEKNRVSEEKNRRGGRAKESRKIKEDRERR